MLVRLLIYFIVGVLIYRMVKGWMGGTAGTQTKVDGQAPEQVDDVMIKDPVCGAYFPKRNGVPLNHGGELLFFCSEKCRDRYPDQTSEDR
jgi:uncharacterized protein